jgi:hypothetical protein
MPDENAPQKYVQDVKGIMFSQTVRADLLDTLERALGRKTDEAEKHLWVSMLPDRRKLTLKRIEVLRRWEDNPGEQTAAEAAREAEVKVSRFYEIVGAWKSTHTLSALGTFANRPGRHGPRLDGDVVNRIQTVLVPIVAEHRSEKVSRIVAALQEHDDFKGVELPHVNTLRTMVERELRRLRGEQQVGVRPGLDVVACDLLRPDGSHHVMFGILDRTSRYVLGFSVGQLSDSVSGYARAARDALARIAGPDSSALPWADETTRVDVIVGEDLDRWLPIFRKHEAEPIVPTFAPVDSRGRYGRYFKLITGKAIGRMKIWPARTDGGGVVNENARVYTDAEAVEAIEIEVARHNSEVLAASVATGSARPAPMTVRILEFVSAASGGHSTA